jgi:hypothetical protein
MRTVEYERELQRRLTVYQQKYDSALEPFKRSAPCPPRGVGANEYRRAGLGYIQQFLPADSKWRDISLDGMRSDALAVAEEQILADAERTARHPKLMADTPTARPDATNPNIKMVTVVKGGVETREFYGESFVREMGRPGRRVIGFMNNPALMPQR